MTDTSSQPKFAWYAAQVRWHAERLVEDTLRRRGVETFLPMATVKIRHARQEHIVARPAFPRYVFVGLDKAAPNFDLVRRTHGVHWMLEVAGKPAPIPLRAVDKIRQMEADGAFDEVNPKRLPVVAGDKVSVVDDRFEAFGAEVIAAKSERRIEVLLSLLNGKAMKLVLPLAQLKKIA
ncbi:transcription termination/antitermination protein NusG [Chelatococcus reniformis]|uniref:Transcription antitermination protein RfaH n=1 Tax=Chelatococcus reniformis TaxID=1494448 RepID=A0A916UD55_9HYPH|nr:transcription termination/antitermination NusG family protein [Chelatococcus reniformis]GGC68443.1 transcription antitermination protein RfaH [Chelatococcus reniformis]